MNGLDDWITGKNDPNNPANQTDWTEQFSPILEHAEWLTEEFIDEGDNYRIIGNHLNDIFENKVLKNKWFSSKDRHNFLIFNAKFIAEELAKAMFKTESNV